MNVSIDLVKSDDEQRVVWHFFLAFFYDLSRYDPNITIVESGLAALRAFGQPGAAHFR